MGLRSWRRAATSQEHEWRCWVDGCDLRMPITREEIDGVGFCQVHHLIQHHGLKPEALVEAEPSLAAEVEAY